MRPRNFNTRCQSTGPLLLSLVSGCYNNFLLNFNERTVAGNTACAQPLYFRMQAGENDAASTHSRRSASEITISRNLNYSFYLHVFRISKYTPKMVPGLRIDDFEPGPSKLGVEFGVSYFFIACNG